MGQLENHMNWLLLTAISIVFRSIYGLMTKVLSNQKELSVFTQSLLLSIAGAVVSLIISPILGGISLKLDQVNPLALLLVTVPSGLGNVIYFEAMKKLTNSTSQIAFSSILIFNTVLGLVFLNLRLSLINVLGLVLLAAAILMVVSGKVELRRREVLLMILAAFMFSLFQLSSAAVAKQVSVATYLFLANLGSAVVILVLRSKQIFNNLRQIKLNYFVFAIPVLTALPTLAYSSFAFYAYRTAPEPTKVAMLLPAQVVLTVILSYFFLKERNRLAIKLLAAVLVVIAAMMIKI